MPGATDEAIAIGGDHHGLIVSSGVAQEYHYISKTGFRRFNGHVRGDKCTRYISNTTSRMTVLTMSCRDTCAIITLGLHEKGEKDERQQATILV